MSKKSNYITTNRSKHYLKCHLIFVCKYRKPMLIGQLNDDIKQIFQSIADGSDFEIEVIPGITSFTGCAAAAGISLAEKDEIVVIVPKVDKRLDRILEYGDTFVIMKTSRHSEILEEVVSRDKRDKSIISVQNCSMKDENVFEGFSKDKKYLSTTIVKFRDLK